MCICIELLFSKHNTRIIIGMVFKFLSAKLVIETDNSENLFRKSKPKLKYCILGHHEKET